METLTITVDQAAKLSGIGRDQLKEWAKNDKTFPAFAVGRDIHIPVDSFREWINERGRLRVDMPAPESPIARRIKVVRKRRAE